TSFIAVGNYSSANLATTFQCAEHDSLVFSASTSDAALPLFNVHVAGFSTDEGFVNFDFAVQLAEEFILQGQTNAVHHKPSSFLSDSYVLGDLATADSILAISEQPHGGKPLIKTDGGVFAKASDLNGKFAFEVMTGASPGASLCTKFNFGRPATGASDYAIRPAPDGQIVDAVVGIREVQDCFLQALWFAHKCLVHCLNS